MNPAKQLKILLVDDDKDMCDSLSDVITLDSEYSVSSTINPVEAVEIVKNEDFDLIIVDYKMPEMNGIDLIKHIKELRPDQKIFILTAFISSELITQAKDEGAAKVLSKFIWPDEILKHIKETIG